MKTDIEIANSIKLKPIFAIAEKLGLTADDLILYGNYKAKINASAVKKIRENKRGKLILVTAVNPTAMGEGKTTVSIGLADGIASLKKTVCLALREPSLGPCFGLKGGAAGGGFSQIAPMADINLHFNGDIHALTAANNLLCSMIDNHLHWGNKLGIKNIFVPRALDLNDRSLRQIKIGLGKTNAPERDDGFIITVATELMAILCLSKDIFDLQNKIGDIIIGEVETGDFIRARDLRADGAMAALLKDAILPNLVQTLEGTPALVHGGPFANIAHGCNSIVATETALGLADYVITEAGFGADLGAEKFFDIKCRKTGLKPSAVVIVVTPRALNYDNLRIHIENMMHFGAPVIVALNRVQDASTSEISALRKFTEKMSVVTELCDAWGQGSIGAKNLADSVIKLCEQKSDLNLLYPDEIELIDKARIIAQKIYRADDIAPSEKVIQKLQQFKEAGFSNLPICIAKTPLQLLPENPLPLKDAFLYAGAGMIVVTAGTIMRMPGLPEKPAAENIRIDKNGEIVGLF